jgi:enoyl-CoA hydratase/carnithine racemase
LGRRGISVSNPANSSSADDATVLSTFADGIATIYLHRPDRLNAVTAQMETELLEAMRQAEASDDVRVIILTGSGRGFCAGADMSLLGNLSDFDWKHGDLDELRAKLCPPQPHPTARDDFQKTYSYFPSISKPVIGAINGATVGLGFVLALYCDIRMASASARFGTAFAQRGLIAEHGISWMLPRLVGLSNALDLLYSARLIDAQEALAMGLVSRVLPDDELLEHVQSYAEQLATTVSPRSLANMKREVYNALFQPLGEAIEAANRDMVKSFTCEDFKEGVAHFMEKRLPRFTGR